jgi:hypothetical protein
VSEAQAATIFLTPNGVAGVPLTLLASNQSSAAPRIDLTVSIDGQVVLSQDIEMSDMGHAAVQRVVHLTKGAHRIEAHSQAGDAELNERFKISSERWATLDYWYEGGVRNGTQVNRSFAFKIHDKPVFIR